MANPAEVVAVELLARVEGFDGKVRQSASTFGGEMRRIEQSAERAERGVSRSLATVERSLARTAQSSRLLGYQISDIGVQLAAGTSPFLVLAQQGPQVANALDGAKGAVGRFATFLSGPWGAAILAATTILGTFLTRNKETGDSVDALVEKMQAQARQSNLNDEATAIFARTLEGVEKATKDAEKAIDSLRLVQKGQAAQTAESIRQTLKDAEATRETARTKLQAALAVLELEKAQANSTFANADEAIAQQRLLDERIASVKQLQGELSKAEDFAKRQSRALDQAISARTVEEENASAIEKANRFFDKLIDDAARAANASKQSQAELRKEIRAINDRREAKLKEIRDTEQASRKRSTDTGDATRFISPVSGGTIRGQFGENRGNRNHAGIDIAVPVGTQVKAPAGGVIIEAGTLPGYGNVVYIDHGRGTISRLAHLSKIGVAKGDIVNQGDIIGLSGGARGAPGSGNSRGPHLHQEVRINGRPVDPRKGPFATDPASVHDNAERVAQEEERRRQTFENELATLIGREIEARTALVTNAEEQARLELQSIEVARQKYDDNLSSLVEQGKLKDYEAEELRLVNNKLAQLRTDAANRREEARQRRESLSVAQDLIDNRLDDLRSEEDLATTQKERRRVALEILDAEYEKLRLTLEGQIKEAEINGASQAVLDAMRQRLAALSTQKANATEATLRGTAGPVEDYLRGISDTADELDEQFEEIAAGGLRSIVDGLGQAASGFDSLGDVALRTLQEITAALIRMAAQQLILKALGSAFGLGFSGGGAIPGNAGGMDLRGFKLSTGGLISGPGTSTSDSISGITTSGRPLRLSDGEYVIRGAAVRKIGVAALDQINATGVLPAGFAGGGALSRRVSPMNANASSAAPQLKVVSAPQFDLRGAVMTPQLYADMERISKANALQAGLAAVKESGRRAPAAVARAQRYGSP